MSPVPKRFPSRFLALINPLSGGSHGEQVLVELKQLIQDGVLCGDVEPIDFARLGEQLSRLHQYSCLLIAGGDGTISQIVGKAKDSTIPVGILPLGTGNDLARELQIPPLQTGSRATSLLERFCLDRYKDFTTWSVHIGDKHYLMLNYLSLGFDASVAYAFGSTRALLHTRLKANLWGRRLRYVTLALGRLQERLPEDCTLALDDQPIDLSPAPCCLIVANIASYMGVGISNKESDPTDGFLEVLTCRTPLALGAMMLPSLPCSKAASLGRAATLEIHSSKTPLYMQIDGEPLVVKPSQPVRVKQCSSVKLLHL